MLAAGQEVTGLMTYSYRCPKHTLGERQEFLLQGKAWRNLDTRPLDKLLLTDLKKELRLRNRDVSGKKKPALEKEFEELRMRISNFPALLRGNPQATLLSSNLQSYEISPT